MISSGDRACRDDEPARRLRGTLILVGLMGSGKSTVGRLIAKRLSLPFVDSDAEIEKAADMTIAELFTRYGEECFRQGEQQVLERLIDGIPKVIATGGGAFINETTRNLMLERGFVVWLDADLDTLVRRASRWRGKRPLLRGQDPYRVMYELAAARNPVYALANLRIENATGNSKRAVDEIIVAFRAYRRRVAVERLG